MVRGRSEICELRWDDIDLHAAAIHVKRLKHGKATTHQIGGDEMRALQKLQRDQEPKSAFVFVKRARHTVRAFHMADA